MNLRQKYKRAKQQLEQYKNETSKPLYIREEKQIETLRATYAIDSYNIYDLRVEPEENFIRNVLSRQLSEYIKERMILTRRSNMTSGVTYTAEIKIVK